MGLLADSSNSVAQKRSSTQKSAGSKQTHLAQYFGCPKSPATIPFTDISRLPTSPEIKQLIVGNVRAEISSLLPSELVAVSCEGSTIMETSVAGSTTASERIRCRYSPQIKRLAMDVYNQSDMTKNHALAFIHKSTGCSRISQEQVRKWIRLEKEAKPKKRVGRKVNEEFEREVFDQCTLSALSKSDLSNGSSCATPQLLANGIYSYEVVRQCAEIVRKRHYTIGNRTICKWELDPLVKNLKFSNKWVGNALRRRVLRDRRVMTEAKIEPPLHEIHSAMKTIHDMQEELNTPSEVDAEETPSGQSDPVPIDCDTNDDDEDDEENDEEEQQQLAAVEAAATNETRRIAHNEDDSVAQVLDSNSFSDLSSLTNSRKDGTTLIDDFEMLEVCIAPLRLKLSLSSIAGSPFEQQQLMLEIIHLFEIQSPLLFNKDIWLVSLTSEGLNLDDMSTIPGDGFCWYVFLALVWLGSSNSFPNELPVVNRLDKLGGMLKLGLDLYGSRLTPAQLTQTAHNNLSNMPMSLKDRYDHVSDTITDPKYLDVNYWGGPAVDPLISPCEGSFSLWRVHPTSIKEPSSCSMASLIAAVPPQSCATEKSAFSLAELRATFSCPQHLIGLHQHHHFYLARMPDERLARGAFLSDKLSQCTSLMQEKVQRFAGDNRLIA